MGKEWDAFAPDRTRYHGERADTRKNVGADASKPSSRHRVSFEMGRPTFRRCTKCKKREFSGSPCRCDAPTWVYEQPEGTPTRMRAFETFNAAWAREVYRVLKPGAHLLAFGGTRTYHRLACAIEDAGFEVRDCLMWIYGSGFPKSLNLGNGWGTALKPAYEPILLARKPLAGTVAAKVERYGTGAIKIDRCRVGMMRPEEVARSGRSTSGMFAKGGVDWRSDGRKPQGRWPANVLHDGSDEVVAAFEAFGEKTTKPGIYRNDSGARSMFGRLDCRAIL